MHFQENFICDSCFRAKQTRSSFPLSNKRAAKCFDLIHCDLWGAYRQASSCGAYYYLTIIDDCSRSVWVYLLKEKSEASTYLVDFCRLVETQFNKIVKRIRSDDGLEFDSGPMKQFYREQGMIHETSCTNTPQ